MLISGGRSGKKQLSPAANGLPGTMHCFKSICKAGFRGRLLAIHRDTCFVCFNAVLLFLLLVLQFTVGHIKDGA